MHKVARNIYEDMFDEEPLPVEYVPPASKDQKTKSPQKSKQAMEVKPGQSSGVPPEQNQTRPSQGDRGMISSLTDGVLPLDSEELRNKPGNDPCFNSYVPKDVFKYLNKIKDWGLVDSTQFMEIPNKQSLIIGH